MHRGTKGQSTAEYAILIAVVIAAVVGMQVYVKRGLQGKEKDVADHLTSTGTKTLTSKALKQYEPYYAESDFQVDQNEETRVLFQTGGKVDRNVIADTTKRTGSSKQGVGLTQDDTWQ